MKGSCSVNTATVNHGVQHWDAVVWERLHRAAGCLYESRLRFSSIISRQSTR